MAEFKAHPNQGTMLQPDRAALVADLDGGLSLFLPDDSDNSTATIALQLLVATAVRSDDPEWVGEMLESMHKRKQQS